MPFDWSDKEIAGFLRELRRILTKAAKRMGAVNQAYTGLGWEDAVQEVLLEVSDFLIRGTPLTPFKKNEALVIETDDDLTRYALRRLRRVHGRMAEAAKRGARLAKDRHIDFVERTVVGPAPTDHEIFDRAFLLSILKDVASDRLAHRYVLLILCSHVLPGTEDLDPCENTAIARLLGCETAEVRNARYRIQTLKNRLLAQRLADVLEDTSND